jgi:hypothetical protein
MPRFGYFYHLISIRENLENGVSESFLKIGPLSIFAYFKT